MKSSLRWKIVVFVCVFLANYLVLAKSSTLAVSRNREKGSTEGIPKGLELSRDAWTSIPHALQEVLNSIDDRLRGLDTFGYTLKLARLDFSMEQMVRRLDNIETKLGRFETKFDMRMEKVEEVVIGKDLKEEFSNEHLSRRMGDLNEKLNNKAAFLDAKIDIKMERITSKLELLERDVQSSADDILERIVKSDEHRAQFENVVTPRLHKLDSIENTVNDLKMFLKEELTNLVKNEARKTTSAIESGIVRVQDHMDTVHGTRITNDSALNTLQRIESTVREIKSQTENFTSHCNKNSDSRPRYLSTLEHGRNNGGQTDQKLENITSILQKAFKASEVKLRDLDTDVEVYARKVINSIQELWKTAQEIKKFLLDALEQGNKTRTMVREEFRKAQEQIRPLLMFEPKLKSVREEIDKRVDELSAAVDNSFATILVAQNTFIASCHRIQEEEAQIYNILQQIVFEMRNRSVSDIQRISEVLHTHTLEEQKILENIFNSIVLLGSNTTSEIRQLFNATKHNGQAGTDANVCHHDHLVHEEEELSDPDSEADSIHESITRENGTALSEYEYELSDVDYTD